MFAMLFTSIQLFSVYVTDEERPTKQSIGLHKMSLFDINIYEHFKLRLPYYEQTLFR